MLVRFILRGLNPALRKDISIIRQSTKRAASLDKPATMNDLPLPNGSWIEDYNRKNRKYNLILATAIFTVITTISVGNSMEIIHWNRKIPRLD